MAATASSRMVDQVDSNPGRIKPTIMKFVCVKNYGARAKIGWRGIRIMCLNGAKCIPVDCCLNNELAL